MSNVVKLRPGMPDEFIQNPQPDIIDTSAQAMARLALWEALWESARGDDDADLRLKRDVADHAVKKGIPNTIQLLRQEIKDLLAWKASVEALSHD